MADRRPLCKSTLEQNESFSLDQSIASHLMLWIGTLRGEIRNTTGSWLMSWFRYFGYNITVLYLLSVLHHLSRIRHNGTIVES